MIFPSHDLQVRKNARHARIRENEHEREEGRVKMEIKEEP